MFLIKEFQFFFIKILLFMYDAEPQKYNSF